MNESEFVEMPACVRNAEVLRQLRRACGLGSDTETCMQPSPVCVYVPHMNVCVCVCEFENVCNSGVVSRSQKKRRTALVVIYGSHSIVREAPVFPEVFATRAKTTLLFLSSSRQSASQLTALLPLSYTGLLHLLREWNTCPNFVDKPLFCSKNCSMARNGEVCESSANCLQTVVMSDLLQPLQPAKQRAFIQSCSLPVVCLFHVTI